MQLCVGKLELVHVENLAACLLRGPGRHVVGEHWNSTLFTEEPGASGAETLLGSLAG